MMFLDDVFDPVWAEDSILAYSDALDNGTQQNRKQQKKKMILVWNEKTT